MEGCEDGGALAAAAAIELGSLTKFNRFKQHAKEPALEFESARGSGSIRQRVDGYKVSWRSLILVPIPIVQAPRLACYQKGGGRGLFEERVVCLHTAAVV